MPGQNEEGWGENTGRGHREKGRENEGAATQRDGHSLQAEWIAVIESSESARANCSSEEVIKVRGQGGRPRSARVGGLEGNQHCSMLVLTILESQTGPDTV